MTQITGLDLVANLETEIALGRVSVYRQYVPMHVIGSGW